MDSKHLPQENIDLNSLVKPYLKKWIWFVFSVIFFVIFGFLYIRYTVPKYAVQAKIQILDDESSGSALNVFKDLDALTGGGEADIIDEIEILSSRSNMLNIVDELGLNTTIVELGNIRDSDLYLTPPFKINYLAPDSTVYNSDVDFFITITSKTSFKYGLDKDSVGVRSFGKKISTPIGDIILTPNNLDWDYYIGKEYMVSVRPLSFIAEIYQNNIQLSVSNDKSNIITISLEDEIRARGMDVVNAMIKNYNENAVSDKKAIADKTSNFIDDRIADIYGNLSSVDQSAEDFQSGRGIADIATQTNVNLNMGAASQQELQSASIQLDISSSMKDLVENQDGYDLLPSNVGLADATIASTTARYNELALERKRLLESSNEKNPIIVNLDQQLNGLKRSMLSSLNSTTSNLSLRVNSLSNQVSKINSKIYSAPKNARALRDITRQQQTTESLYLYLLQKREESQITFASASPKSKVIDWAYLANELPVSPKKPIILMACFILGLSFPFAIIYIKDLLDNKIHSKTGLEKLTGNVPVLAELPKLSKKESTLVKTNERTVLAESLRILRTNLDYVLNSRRSAEDRTARTIFVTSSVPGEGKTLVSSNLAMIFANAGKRVLLIGADIRNPKIYEFYSGKDVDKLKRVSKNQNNLGLTEFLVDKSLEPKEIVSPMLANDQTLDVIFSGEVPPNPTELLMSNRLSTLFEWVKEKYDYVIVDTAPVMLVSDTLLISQYADQTLYITRAGMTETDVIDFPIGLEKEGKLKGLSFVVNGVKESELGYGGKYGYGYGATKRKWYSLR